MDILKQIVDATRKALDLERVDLPGLERDARALRAERVPHAFAAALRGGRQSRDGERPARVIAEVKAASPSAGEIEPEPAVEEIASSYRRGGASAISVVTEPRFFGGSHDWLMRASRATSLPVIMKDFVIDPIQLHRGAAAGADAVLLLASVLDRVRLRDFIQLLNEYGVDAVVEVHDERELEEALAADATIVGVNNRNLRDFSVSLATSERVVAAIPANVIRVSESGITTRNDVERLLDAGYDAFLVGESLLRQADRERAVRMLTLGAAVSPQREEG